MLFEDAPFFSFFGLRALFVVAPLDGIAHRRHGFTWCVLSPRDFGHSDASRDLMTIQNLEVHSLGKDRQLASGRLVL